MNDINLQSRQNNRLQTLANDVAPILTSKNYQVSISTFLPLSDEEFIKNLPNLQSYYLLSKEMDLQSDALIMERLVFTLGLQPDYFIDHTNVLICLIYRYRHTLRKFKILRDFLQMAIEYLTSDNTEFKKQMLIIISNITSFSKHLSLSTFRIIPFQIFFNIITESIDLIESDQIYDDMIQYVSHIIFNVFYAVKNYQAENVYPEEFINSLFQIIKDIFTSHAVCTYNDLLKCVEDIVNSNSEYCIMFQQYELIGFLNHNLTLVDMPEIQITTLAILVHLVRNSIQTDDIDILLVYNLIPNENGDLMNAALCVIEMFLAKNPEGCDVFFELGILPQIEAVLENSSFRDNLKILSIIITLLNHSTPQNQFLLVQSRAIITFLINFTTNVEDPLVISIFNILRVMIEIASSNSYTEINDIFNEQDHISIIEENSLKNSSVSEVAQRFLDYLNEIKS